MESLTDLHYFLPDDFETWNREVSRFKTYNEAQANIENLDKLKYQMEMKSCDYSWAAGPEMIADLKDRIPKAVDFWPEDKGHFKDNQTMKKWIPMAGLRER